jgi:hypothetical protein
MTPKIKVLIEVRGGTVQAVYADSPIEVRVLDWDDVVAGDVLPARLTFGDGVTAYEFAADGRQVL